MSHMKAATVRDLRNDFGRVSKWIEAGEVVQVFKRGKPYARVIPEPKARTFVGAGAGTMKLPEDLDAPATVEWEATR